MPDAAAFNKAVEGDSARSSDCFVCRNLVSSRELVPHVVAPHVVVTQCVATLTAAPVLAETFRPSSPRAPPAA